MSEKVSQSIVFFCVIGGFLLCIPLISGLINGNLVFLQGDHGSLAFQDTMGEEGELYVSSSGEIGSYSIELDGITLTESIKNPETREWYPDYIHMQKGCRTGDLTGMSCFHSHYKKVMAKVSFPTRIFQNDTVQIIINSSYTGVHFKVPKYDVQITLNEDPQTINLTGKGGNFIHFMAYSCHHFTFTASFKKIRQFYTFDSEVIEIYPQQSGILEGIHNLALHLQYTDGHTEVLSSPVMLDYSTPEITLSKFPTNDTVIFEPQSVQWTGTVTDRIDTDAYLSIIAENVTTIYSLPLGTNGSMNQILTPQSGEYTWVLWAEDALGHRSEIYGNFSVLPADANYSRISVIPPAYHDGTEENIEIDIDIDSSFTMLDYSIIITNLNTSDQYLNQTLLPAICENTEYNIKIYENGTLVIDFEFMVLFIPPPQPEQDDFGVYYQNPMGETGNISIPFDDVDTYIIKVNETLMTNATPTGEVHQGSAMIFLDPKGQGVNEGLNNLELFVNLTNGRACNLTDTMLMDYSAPIISYNVPLNESMFKYNESAAFSAHVVDSTDVTTELCIRNSEGIVKYSIVGADTIYQNLIAVPDNYTWTLTSIDVLGHMSLIKGNFSVSPYIPPDPEFTNILIDLPERYSEKDDTELRYTVTISSNAESEFIILIHDKTHEKLYTKTSGTFSTPAIGEATEFNVKVLADGEVLLNMDYSVAYIPAPKYNILDILPVIIACATVILLGVMLSLKSKKRKRTDNSIIRPIHEEIETFNTDLESVQVFPQKLFRILMAIIMLFITVMLLIQFDLISTNLSGGNFFNETMGSNTAAILWTGLGIGVILVGIYAYSRGNKEKAALALLYGEVIEDTSSDEFYRLAFDGKKYDGEMGKFQQQMKKRYEKTHKSKIVKRCKDIHKRRKDMVGLIPTREMVEMNRYDGEAIYKPTIEGYMYEDKETGKKDYLIVNKDALLSNTSRRAEKIREKIKIQEPDIDDSIKEFKEFKNNIEEYKKKHPKPKKNTN
ncbi:MAG: hypothetical protein GF364_17135 [Candidatus Lokiarchaeota archaeon]|nr:hypothetical protein [Candidatus Lokiarchaeota archaeon]